MDWLRTVLSLIGVVGLIILLFYALQKLNKAKRITSGGKMHILDRVNLGRDGMLLVVSVCGRLMLIGAGSGRIEKLCDLDMTEEEYFPDSGQSAPDFRTILGNMTGRNKTGEPASDGEAEGEEDGKNA